MRKTLLIAICVSLMLGFQPFWGFFAHGKINGLAVFTLPPPMIGFYKKNLAYIKDASVNPDKRRYAVPEEAPRHYLDFDHYDDSVRLLLPHAWHEAIKIYHADSLIAYGILPWHIIQVYGQLRDAFMVKDPSTILRLSAELGHYLADAHVPLHTTENYNGQLSGQDGIHGLWESRLPELYSPEYNFFVGPCEYIADVQATAWQIIANSHDLVDSVLHQEKILGVKFEEKKYTFDTKGMQTIKVYAPEFAIAYHQALNGMVEEQMRASIKSIGSFWYSAWVDAGQPDLKLLIDYAPSEKELQKNREELLKRKKKILHSRSHEE